MTRILLIRHGQPHIALRPRTGHAGFAAYMAAYEEAGLSPANLPPRELQDLAHELDHVCTSSLPRSYQSAAALAPHAEQIADPLFVEAPLAAPVIPLLQMRVSKWAVLSRLLWHVGFHPGIESPRRAAKRAAQAADNLIARARKSGVTALVAHGYFNWMIGRQLARRGFARKGSHRAQYWNIVIYERPDGDDETRVEIPGIGAEAFLFRPDAIADFPGIVFLTDIWGIRPANIGMAKRLAGKGFAVLLPNAFHRHGRIAPDGFEPADAKDRMAALGMLFRTLTPAQMESDGAAYVDFLLAQKGVIQGKLGVVGHCFTGQMALRMAAAVPDRIAAAASLHGGWLATDGPDSPHLLLPRISARLYFAHADQDSMMPAPEIERLERALRDWRGAFQSETYKGALHGWTVPGRDIYNELQAERAFEKEVELFDATLK